MHDLVSFSYIRNDVDYEAKTLGLMDKVKHHDNITVFSEEMKIMPTMILRVRESYQNVMLPSWFPEPNFSWPCIF